MASNTISSSTSTNDDDNVNDNSRFMVSVSEHLPSLEECYQFVVTGGSGAVSTFVGITRDNFQGKTVLRLSYEGYVPMANKELLKLCRDCTQKYPAVEKIAAVHILGDCPVGHASVILAASSPHRRESLHATEYLIDELKLRIPIWKKEVYAGDGKNGEGESVWKENTKTREMEPVTSC